VVGVGEYVDTLEIRIGVAQVLIGRHPIL
jgi:hypothetical protein